MWHMTALFIEEFGVNDGVIELNSPVLQWQKVQYGQYFDAGMFPVLPT